jgi:hypothetical protein
VSYIGAPLKWASFNARFSFISSFSLSNSDEGGDEEAMHQKLHTQLSFGLDENDEDEENKDDENGEERKKEPEEVANGQQSSKEEEKEAKSLEKSKETDAKTATTTGKHHRHYEDAASCYLCIKVNKNKDVINCPLNRKMKNRLSSEFWFQMDDKRYETNKTNCS